LPTLFCSISISECSDQISWKTVKFAYPINSFKEKGILQKEKKTKNENKNNRTLSVHNMQTCTSQTLIFLTNIAPRRFEVTLMESTPFLPFCSGIISSPGIICRTYLGIICGSRSFAGLHSNNFHENTIHRLILHFFCLSLASCNFSHRNLHFC